VNIDGYMKRKLDNGYMKRKFYDSTKVLLEEIPQELYEKKFTCTNCGYVDKVPWITKRAPIKAVPVFKCELRDEIEASSSITLNY
jgi:hypothetical protein